jgi:NADH-quinone oxidoreductase subunit H
LPGTFWFGFKICFFVVLFIFMRAALPRYRYDQLMSLGWKVFVPVSLVLFLLVSLIVISFQMQPF